MKEEIYKIIEQVVNEKKEAKKHPLIVLDMELDKAVRKEVLKVLKELYAEEKIDFGRTVNNNYIKLRTDTNPRSKRVDLHKIYKSDEKD